MSWRPLMCSLALAGVAAGCGTSARRDCTVHDRKVGYVHRIGCTHDYAALASTHGTRPPDTLNVNFVVDRQDHNRVYFLDSDAWELHIDFAFLVLAHRQPDLQEWDQFIADNYVSPRRRFYLGKLVRYPNARETVFQTWEGDQASPQLIADSFALVRRQLFDGAELRFRPTSLVQQQRLAEIAALIPIADPAEVSAGTRYQSLNGGTGVGRLRFIERARLENERPLSTDIVVLDDMPADLPPVQGLITSVLQTPLSHVNLLCQQRATPNMALVGAFEATELRALEGQLVQISVQPTRWQIDPISDDKARQAWDRQRAPHPVPLRHQPGPPIIIDLDGADVDDADRIGAKAANFAALMRLQPTVRTPRPAFAIPFAAFEQHLRDNGLWDELEAILAERPVGVALEGRLFQLRWHLYNAPVAPQLLDAIENLLRQRFADVQVRLRSSTNAEDLPGFNGAGLHTSVGTSLRAGREGIARALKTVWASAFNYAAFVEREQHHIEQRDVRMGVLIHRAFSHERVNGVALAYSPPEAHSYSLLKPSLYINAQKGDASVTNPSRGETPEQALWYVGNEAVPGWLDLASRSSLSPDKQLMSDAQYAELARQLLALRGQLPLCRGDSATRCTLDVEWKLDEDGLVYVKQARPLVR